MSLLHTSPCLLFFALPNMNGEFVKIGDGFYRKSEIVGITIDHTVTPFGKAAVLIFLRGNSNPVREFILSPIDLEHLICNVMTLSCNAGNPLVQ